MSQSDAFRAASGSLNPKFTKSPQELEEAQQFFTAQPSRPIQIQECDGRLAVMLPLQGEGSNDWNAVLRRLEQRLANPDVHWKNTAGVDLIVGQRLLDQRQLQVVAKTLLNAKLRLDCIHTSRRQTAVAAVTAGYSVQQTRPDELTEKLQTEKLSNLKLPLQGEADISERPLLIQKTVRSGSEIRHSGHVILIGDLNPGGTIIADGDILVWGRLKGVAHAGANGNRDACIMALQMDPTQLRIADKVARAPAAQPDEFFPEVAHIAATGIRITRANEFSKLI